MLTDALEVVEGDITTVDVDAIVNAANGTLLGGGGVDGAIHRAAGPELLDVCRPLGGCRTGEAKITPGFALPAQWVIHTVGPVWPQHTPDDADHLLRSCYQRSFERAMAVDARSIAFPAISTGVFAFPADRAAAIAVNACADAAPKFDRIVLVGHTPEDAERYRNLLEDIRN